MWDNVSTGHQNYNALCKHGSKNYYILIQSSLSHVYALWRYKAERDHPAADALVRCSMKMIAVQTIIYDLYLARTGNCDRGTSHKCETVGLKQYSTERVWNGFIAWCNSKDNRIEWLLMFIYKNYFTFISYELMRHNCQGYGVCWFIVFVWGPCISEWDSETNCFTIIQL